MSVEALLATAALDDLVNGHGRFAVDHLADVVRVPEGTKKLRASILALALSGRLIEDWPDDDSVEYLLQDIDQSVDGASKRAVRNEQAYPPVGIEEQPYSIPNTWTWVRLGRLGYWGSGSGFPRSEQGRQGLEFPFYKVSDMNRFERVMGEAANSISADDVSRLRVSVLPEGTIVFPKIGGAIATNKRRVLARPSCIDNNCLGFVGASALDADWLFILFLAFDFSRYQQGTSLPALSQKALSQIPVALPPLSHQRLIATRVNEALQTTDALERALVAEENERLRLTKASYRALASRSDTYVLDHIHELTRTAEDVRELEAAVVELAVTGKLSSANVEDEPAATLLSRLKGRALDIPDLTDSKGQPIPEPYKVPAHWRWASLGSLLLDIQAGWSPNAQARPKEDDEWGVLKVSACSWGEFRHWENKALQANQKPRYELEVNVGDFLISRANTSELVGRSVVVEETPPHLMLSDKTLRLIPGDGCNPRFLNLANLSHVARRHYEREATGTSSSMQNVSQRAIRRTPIPVPPREEQDRIVAVVDELAALIRQLRQQLAV